MNKITDVPNLIIAFPKSVIGVGSIIEITINWNPTCTIIEIIVPKNTLILCLPLKIIFCHPLDASWAYKSDSTIKSSKNGIPVMIKKSIPLISEWSELSSILKMMVKLKHIDRSSQRNAPAIRPCFIVSEWCNFVVVIGYPVNGRLPD